jgi:hypothetical protein
MRLSPARAGITARRKAVNRARKTAAQEVPAAVEPLLVAAQRSGLQRAGAGVLADLIAHGVPDDGGDDDQDQQPAQGQPV